MTQWLQLLVAAGVAVGAAWFALYKDKKEHIDDRQDSIAFPDESDHNRRGAAMSRLR
jgi:hypothetical protein